MQHEFESVQMLVLALKNLHLESESTKTIAGNSDQMRLRCINDASFI